MNLSIQTPSINWNYIFLIVIILLLVLGTVLGIIRAVRVSKWKNPDTFVQNTELALKQMPRERRMGLFTQPEIRNSSSGKVADEKGFEYYLFDFMTEMAYQPTVGVDSSRMSGSANILPLYLRQGIRAYYFKLFTSHPFDEDRAMAVVAEGDATTGDILSSSPVRFDTVCAKIMLEAFTRMVPNHEDPLIFVLDFQIHRGANKNSRIVSKVMKEITEVLEKYCMRSGGHNLIGRNFKPRAGGDAISGFADEYKKSVLIFGTGRTDMYQEHPRLKELLCYDLEQQKTATSEAEATVLTSKQIHVLTNREQIMERNKQRMSACIPSPRAETLAELITITPMYEQSGIDLITKTGIQLVGVLHQMLAAEPRPDLYHPSRGVFGKKTFVLKDAERRMKRETHNRPQPQTREVNAKDRTASHPLASAIVF